VATIYASAWLLFRGLAGVGDLLSGMKKGRLMTATVFAQEMGVDYSTVMRRLKRQIVPGAVLRESPERGKWWEIPESALQMERPKWGGPEGGKNAKKKGARAK